MFEQHLDSTFLVATFHIEMASTSQICWILHPGDLVLGLLPCFLQQLPQEALANGVSTISMQVPSPSYEGKKNLWENHPKKPRGKTTKFLFSPKALYIHLRFIGQNYLIFLLRASLLLRPNAMNNFVTLSASSTVKTKQASLLWMVFGA